jgi:hypothetical protein
MSALVLGSPRNEQKASVAGVSKPDHAQQTTEVCYMQPCIRGVPYVQVYSTFRHS